MGVLQIKSTSAQQTMALGTSLGKLLAPGDVVALIGDLGAGKTCFVQGLARGLGIDVQVTSPTFVLLKEYEGRLPLYHFDAYRLNGPEELVALGSAEYFASDGVCVIEWADRVASALPADRIEVELHRIPGADEARLVVFKGSGSRSQSVVEGLKRALGFGN